MSDRRLLFIVNDSAGGASARGRLDALRRGNPRLADASLTTTFSRPEDISASLAGHPDRLPVAVGGDGTVNLVARALRATGRTREAMGIVPMGTGNLVAHEIGVRSHEAAVAALLDGDPRAVDVMVTTREDFPLALMSVSTGFESDFIRSYAKWRSRLGRPGGALIGALHLLGPRTRGGRIDLDAQPFLTPATSFRNAGLYTMRSFAFGIVVHPDAVADDGFGEATIDLGVPSYARALARGRRYPADADHPTYRRWRTAIVEPGRSLQIDGESVTPSAFEVRVEQAGLRILGPAR